MSRATRTVRVQPIPGEALRYWVESWTNATRPHLVDLAEHFGNGSCSCTDFLTRRQPAIVEGKRLFTDATSCRHVTAARRHFTEHTLADMAEMLGGRPKRRDFPQPTTPP